MQPFGHHYIGLPFPFPLSRGIFPLSEWLKHLIKLFWQEGSSISQIIFLLEK